MTKFQDAHTDEEMSKCWSDIELKEKLDRLRTLLTKHISQVMVDQWWFDKEALISKITDVSKKAMYLSENLRKLCHSEECDDIYGCPAAHETCHNELHPLSSVYWSMAEKLKDFHDQLRALKWHVKKDHVIEQVVTGARAKSMLDVLKTFGNIGNLLDQHPDYEKDEYNELRGYPEFVELMYTDFTQIRWNFDEIMNVMNSILSEMNDFAQETKPKVNKEA